MINLALILLAVVIVLMSVRMYLLEKQVRYLTGAVVMLVDARINDIKTKLGNIPLMWWK